MEKLDTISLLSLGAILVLTANPVLAASVPQSIIRAENGVFLGTGVLLFGNTETYGSENLGHQNGSLWMYSAGLMGLSRHSGGLYWRLDYMGANGHDHNEGNTVLGLAPQTTTSDNAQNLSGRLGLTMNPLWRRDWRGVLIPYLSLGVQRETLGAGLEGLTGSSQEYNNGRWGLGLRYDDAIDHHWVIAFHVTTGYTIGSQWSGDVPTGYNTQTGILSYALMSEALGNRPYLAYGAKIAYLFCYDWQIAFHARRSQWSYGAPAPFIIPTQSGGILKTSAIPARSVTQTLLMLDVSTFF